MEKMEEIMEKMGGYICDSICRHTADDRLDQEHLADICEECELSGHICHAMKEYEKAKGGRRQPAPWSDGMLSRFMKVY